MDDRKAYIDKLTAQLKISDSQSQKLEQEIKEANQQARTNLRREMDKLPNQQSTI